MQNLQRTATLCFAFALSLTCAAQHRSPLAAYIKEDAPVLVLDHVRVIDGTGAAPQEDMRIVIAGGTITAIQDAKSQADYPANAKVLDMTGKTVMPGLVGMHEHLFYPLPDRPADGLALYAEAAAIAPETAKYWLGIRHSSFAPTAASASASLKPGTLRKRFNTRRTRSRLPVSPKYCCTRAALHSEATSLQATSRTVSERLAIRRLAASKRDDASTTTYR